MEQKRYTILFAGPSRCGKDSTINTLAQKDVAKPGKANTGEGCTREPEVYDITVHGTDQKLRIINLPGFNDPQMAFTNAELQEKVKEALIEKFKGFFDMDSQIDAILIFENLSNNRNEFRKSYDELVQMFGSKIKDSTILVGNMASRAKLIDTYDYKVAEMKKYTADNKTLFLEFESEGGKFKYQNEDDRKKAIKSFLDTIKQAKPYKLDELDKINQEIKKIAEKLQKDATTTEIIIQRRNSFDWQDVEREEPVMEKVFKLKTTIEEEDYFEVYKSFMAAKILDVIIVKDQSSIEGINQQNKEKLLNNWPLPKQFQVKPYLINFLVVQVNMA